MNNHYHLLIETLLGIYQKACNTLMVFTLSALIKHITGLDEKEGYLLELSRYIVLNPVRVKIVEQEMTGNGVVIYPQ